MLLRKLIVHIFFIVLFIGCKSKTKTINKVVTIDSTKVNWDKNNPNQVYPSAYLVPQYIHLLQNKNIAVVANQTSTIFETHLVDTLLSLGVNIKMVFSPEHGFRGDHDAGAKVEHDIDEKTKIPIFSLHGKTRKPTVESLHDIDFVLFDIQDVGVRFYTYISTLHYIMEACAENEIPLILLDRPNPNAHYVYGPVLKPQFKSFVGMHPVPVVYGASIGEYAKMINGENWLPDSLQCNLLVIPMENWNRNESYKLPIPPSPNLPNQRSVLLYPSLCFFEGTVMNEGRGTDLPFQIYGHPEYLSKKFSYTPRAIPGKSMEPKFKDKMCYGKDLSNLSEEEIINWKKINWSYLQDAYDSTKVDEFFNRVKFFNLLEGDDKIISAIQNKTIQDLEKVWEEEVKSYLKILEKYKLYD
jgi:uncharacterized protein YbbC (DUF1343 family)